MNEHCTSDATNPLKSMKCFKAIHKMIHEALDYNL